MATSKRLDLLHRRLSSSSITQMIKKLMANIAGAAIPLSTARTVQLELHSHELQGVYNMRYLIERRPY
ncbi:hypothetical protein AC249_AIPGENE12433 [Exaiptasia diaphana]|nr:hypothetical protein AC249_AIPGENE12433 [Exaiptasia diaphana]